MGEMSEGQRGPASRRYTNVGARPCGCPGAARGTPDAPRSSASHHHAEPCHRSARNTPSFQTPNPIIPKRNTPSFQTQNNVIPNATSVIPSGARNLGVMREVWRLGALGVPHPAPGQPQGRAPTGALQNIVIPTKVGIHRQTSRSTPNPQRRGTPLWLPRCGAGYAKPTTTINIPPSRRTRSSFRAQHPVIPNAEQCHSARDTPSIRARPLSFRASPPVIPSGARNFGVVREVWRLGALGVPHPAPGQPQGRAPTLLFGSFRGTAENRLARGFATGGLRG